MTPGRLRQLEPAGATNDCGYDTDYWVPAEHVIATISLGGRPRDIVASPDGEHVYVAQADSIAVLGAMHNIVGSIPVAVEPNELLIDTDGRRLLTIGCGGSVSMIDTADHTSRTVSGRGTASVVVSPDGTCVYVALDAAPGPDSAVWLIDFDGEAVATVPVVNDVTALQISSDGTRLYAISSDRCSYYDDPAGCLTIIDTASRTVATTIPVGASPDVVTVSADGVHLYITHYATYSVSAIDLSTNSVTTIALEDAPLDVTVSHDGAHAYVTNLRSLAVIDTVTNQTTNIIVGDQPRGLQISSDGKRAYVANFGDGTVSVIDTVTNLVTATVAVTGHPEVLAVSPDDERLYVGDYWSGAVTVMSIPSVRDQHTAPASGCESC